MQFDFMESGAFPLFFKLLYQSSTVTWSDKQESGISSIPVKIGDSRTQVDGAAPGQFYQPSNENISTDRWISRTTSPATPGPTRVKVGAVLTRLIHPGTAQRA